MGTGGLYCQAVGMLRPYSMKLACNFLKQDMKTIYGALTAVHIKIAKIVKHSFVKKKKK